MKGRIIEIVELGQPQSLIQRENAHTTELLKTDLLIEELNEQLRLYDIVGRSEQLLCPDCKSKTRMQNGFIWCENNDCGGIYRAK